MMDSFSIQVDLSSFFTDFRAKSLVFVNTSSMKTVTHVEKHIKKLFGIDSETYVFSHNNFVPGGEDSRILKHLSIRLTAVSSPNERGRPTEYGNNIEGNGTGESVSNRKRKLEGLPNIDTDETSDIERRSSKKKHKIKQGDNHDVNGDHPSTSHGISVGHSATPEHANHSGAGKVRKDKDQHLSNISSSIIDSNSTNKKDKKKTPNRAFYDSQYEEPSNSPKHVKSHKKDTESYANSIETEHNGTKNETDGRETPSDKDGRDISTSADNPSCKPKRKRVRKRKKANKEETPDELTENIVPDIVQPIRSVKSKLPKANSKHIFFPEVGEDLQTAEEMPENETINAEGPLGSTMTDHPDNKTGPSKEEEINNGLTNGHLLSERLQVSVPKDCVESTGTDEPPSASHPIRNIAKPQAYSGRACLGLGKLLSLIRNDDPPVFERKKIPKNSQAAASGKDDDSPKTSTPISIRSPVRFPSASLEGSTSGAAMPDPDPASLIKEALTPLETLPEKNMKISFQILKMSASYCPELSNSIVAVVKEVDAVTQNLSLKILSGGEECRQPKGKFDLDTEETEEEACVEEINLSWSELVEPKVCQ